MNLGLPFLLIVFVLQQYWTPTINKKRSNKKGRHDIREKIRNSGVVILKLVYDRTHSFSSKTQPGSASLFLIA